ncbi:MAG: hypothetical protein JXR94_04005 [Candidatus Hydrogenedentes bacterium]|nr:hypothetical protein [Candidatus Hydrogenedentota bacterium]
MDVEEFEADALIAKLKAARTGRNDTNGGGTQAALTLRERFRRAMFFQEVAVRPNFEFGYWETTLKRWRDQGLPEHVVDEASAYEYFGIENWVMVPVNLGPTAVCEHKVLEEDEEHQVYRDSMGCVAEINKKGDKSIPHFLDFPIKDRASWEPFKKALDPDDPSRYERIEEALPDLAAATMPVGVPGGSLAGTPRNLCGFERIAVLPYEDPDLFREIVDTFGHCIVTVLERVLPLIQVDFCMGWEDICFNGGPIIHPAVYSEVIGPWYRRIADLLVRHGCCVYTTDTDGNIMPLVDVFVDNGLNTMFPVEVHGGSDPCALREKYGRRVRLWGGFDKMALLKSRQAIDDELDRLLPYVEQGAFLPGVDHRVQADVPLDHYKHYLDRKRELFHVGGEPKY